MESTDFKDLDEVPEAVAATTTAVARNAVHLASTRRNQPYPRYE